MSSTSTTSSSCAAAPASLEAYNLPLHIGALFIILGVSFSACALPILAIRVPSLHIPAKALFVFRHFGTGVLIATAFVHLFPTAFVNLTDPCLPAFFTEGYPAFAGAVALGSVFFISVAEMVFSPGRSLCAGPRVDEREDGGEGEGQGQGQGQDLGNHGGPVRSGRGHRKGSVNQLGAPDQEEDEIQQQDPSHQDSHHHQSLEDDEDSLKTSFHRRKLLAQCLLLECGILFHSIFIGMALAVATGSEQIILLIAISFHQTFEGLALGSRIAAIGWEPKALQPWGMALAYGCTTPLGQALGITTRNLYSPDSQTGSLVVGIMNAISAGLLTYTSLIDLLGEDFLSDESWKTLRGKRRVVAMGLVFLGAFCMSLIGAWA